MEPRINARLFDGSTCRHENGCTITFDNEVFNQLLSTRYHYFLIEGSVTIQYQGEIAQLIESPYPESEITNYIDSWKYGVPVEFTVTPSTRFLRVDLHDFHTEEPIPFTTTVHKFTNDTITKTVKSNSHLVFYGSSYTVDGRLYTDKKVFCVSFNEEKDVIISTTGKLAVVYVEPIT
jgi:hypothetical protein